MDDAPDPTTAAPGRERVYLPLTLSTLAAAVERGVVSTVTAHAVTPALREWYVDGDLEELELAALTDAAQAGLLVLAAQDGGPGRRPRRVVAAADAVLAPPRPPGDRAGRGGQQAAATVPGREVWRSAVVLAAPLAWADVVSVHVDEADAEVDVAAAVAALPAAARGGREALDAVEDAEACDLLWYAPSEVPALLADLRGPDEPGRS